MITFTFTLVPLFNVQRGSPPVWLFLCYNVFLSVVYSVSDCILPEKEV